MAVPAHDSRDYEFAKHFSLPIVQVVAGGNIDEEAYTDTEKGTMINSGFINGLEVKEAQARMIEWLVSEGIGEER